MVAAVAAPCRVLSALTRRPLLDPRRAKLSLSEGPELQALLRSRDATALADELENTQWVQKTLTSRIERLASEVKAAEEEMAEFRKEGSAGSIRASNP